MITTGEYKTRCGYKVIVTEIKLKNDAGSNYTFPIKGNYYIPTKTGKLKSHYTIWTLDGRHGIFKDSKFDIILEAIK